MVEQHTMRGVTAVELRDRAYRTFADSTAVIDHDRTTTYRELGRLAGLVASGLRSRGHEPSERVLLISRNRMEFFAVDHGLARGGFVKVALSPRLHPNEVAFIAADSGATAAFVDREWAEHLSAATDQFPLLRTIVTFDEVDGAEPFAHLLDEAPETYEGPFPEESDLAALWYTSGTTGTPKGAMLSHRSVTAVIRSFMVQEGPPADDEVVLHVAPLSHMSGAWGAPFFLYGAAHVVHARFEPTEVLRAIDQHRVTMIPMVPTIIHAVVDAAVAAGYKTDSVRTILYGGSPISPDKLSRAVSVFGPIFMQLYGMSEFPCVSHLRREWHTVVEGGRPDDRMASAGRPATFVDVRLIDVAGRDVPKGGEGEIVVRGDVACVGYWGMPEATNELIDADGWLHTGDVGRFDDDGFLYVIDRKKETIVSGGFNVYPSEVENAVAVLDDVMEVAVIGVPDDRWGEVVMACVVIRPGSDLSEEDVQAVCRDRLASYKVPKLVEFLDELPKTGSGKIMRRTLRDQRWAGHNRKVG